jgi:hypothetical protein
MLADIAHGHVAFADVMFLVALVLFVVAAVVIVVRRTAVETALIPFGLAAVALGLLVL